MKQHHVIISGTGRAGTTLLVQLLTKLGLDTGFTSVDDQLYPTCNAGMEGSLNAEKAPYIIKNPDFCETLEKELLTGNYEIDYALIPVRDLFSAAQSRIKVSEETPRHTIPKGLSRVPGGIMGTKSKAKQEDVLARRFFQLIYVIVRYDIPHAFLEFPRLALEPIYAYNKLKPVINNVKYLDFERVFQEISKPEMINNFEAKNAGATNSLRNRSQRFFRKFTRT